MPKKLYASEPAYYFDDLLRETHESDPAFSIKTTDPTYESFADELISLHYPPQSELPLLDA